MFKKSLTFILLSSFLLLGCDFRPKHRVIEYQEEVKLSDGSFIWVDIKRHYWLSGGALGDAGNFSNASYMPGIVEISWDTGFEGVGRQSVFFDERVFLIDKINDVWYILGRTYPYDGSIEHTQSINCRDFGIMIHSGYHCIFYIEKQGYYHSNYLSLEQLNRNTINILSPIRLKNSNDNVAEFLDKTKLSWSDKLNLQQTQPKDYQLIGKPYSYLMN